MDRDPTTGYSCAARMSRQELVTAFLDGQISRRTLMRRLIAGGVSAGAAISYAQLLAPERAMAAIGDTQYPLVDLAIVSSSLASVRSNAYIKVSLTSTEELKNGSFRSFVNKGGGGVPLGSKFLAQVLRAAGSRTVNVPVDVSQLTGLTSARLYIQMTAQDAELYSTLASTGKTLS
jgi:hypothetical protein